MADYKKMYFTLFNAMTDTISQLQAAQQKAEEIYIQSGDTPLTALRAQQEAAVIVAETPDAQQTSTREQPAHKLPDHSHQHGRPVGKTHHNNDQSR